MAQARRSAVIQAVLWLLAVNVVANIFGDLAFNEHAGDCLL